MGQVGVELFKKGAALLDEVFVAKEAVGFGQTQGDEVVAAGTEIGQADPRHPRSATKFVTRFCNPRLIK